MLISFPPTLATLLPAHGFFFLLISLTFEYQYFLFFFSWNCVHSHDFQAFIIWWLSAVILSHPSLKSTFTNLFIFYETIMPIHIHSMLDSTASICNKQNTSSLISILINPLCVPSLSLLSRTVFFPILFKGLNVWVTLAKEMPRYVQNTGNSSKIHGSITAFIISAA